MYLDKLLTFSDAQAVTAAAASTDSIDLSQIRDIGTGRNLYIGVNVDVALTDAGSDSTVTVTLETDDNSSFSSVTSTTLFTIPAVSAVGYNAFARIQPGQMNERYAQLRFTPNNGNLSTGSFTAGIIHDIDKTAAYPSGFTVIR